MDESGIHVSRERTPWSRHGVRQPAPALGHLLSDTSFSDTSMAGVNDPLRLQVRGDRRREPVDELVAEHAVRVDAVA